jgi:hypothetical protein
MAGRSVSIVHSRTQTMEFFFIPMAAHITVMIQSGQTLKPKLKKSI